MQQRPSGSTAMANIGLRGASRGPDKPIERKAKAIKDGVIEIDGAVPALAGTLIVVVVRRP